MEPRQTFCAANRYFVILLDADGSLKHVEGFKTEEHRDFIARQCAKGAELFGKRILVARQLDEVENHD